MPIHDILAKIAKGPKTSKDLTWEECKQAMKALIEGEATPAQVGAFLIAMRFKTESVTELAALTAAARQYVPPLAVSRHLALVDVPSYAGKQDTFHALIAASIVAVAAGAASLATEVFAFDDLTELSDEFDSAGTLGNWQRIYQTEGWGNNALEQFDINASRPGRMFMLPHTSRVGP